MKIYQPGQHGDVALLAWYAQLVASGDLAKLLGPSVWGMAAFMRHFIDPQAVLMYEEGPDGAWIAAAWTFPLMGGGTWGLWVSPNYRASGSRRVMNFIMEALAVATGQYPVLVNTTKQDAIVAKTKRLGYSYLGKIPMLFEGEDCHVLYMTREMFQPILERWRAYYERR